MRVLLTILTAGFVGVLAFSYAGAWHPAGDSVAVFRVWLIAGLAVAAMAAFGVGARVIGHIGGASVVLTGGPILLLLLNVGMAPAAQTPFDLAVYSKNTLGGRGDDGALVADIVASGAAVVLLQEVSRTRSDYAQDLQDTHPFSHFCHFSDRSGIGVLSRWPIEDTYCSPHRSFAAAYIRGPDGPFWAVSTHLVWPFPYGQWKHLEQALPFLESVQGRVLVGGDFNMVPWGASVRRVARATGTARLGPLQTTLRIRQVPFQIDHILTTGAGDIALRPLLGSDHHGILARIDWQDD